VRLDRGRNERLESVARRVVGALVESGGRGC
jgi:hypothetical protein